MRTTTLRNGSRVLTPARGVLLAQHYEPVMVIRTDAGKVIIVPRSAVQPEPLVPIRREAKLPLKKMPPMMRAGLVAGA